MVQLIKVYNGPALLLSVMHCYKQIQFGPGCFTQRFGAYYFTYYMILNCWNAPIPKLLHLGFWNFDKFLEFQEDQIALGTSKQGGDGCQTPNRPNPKKN